MKARFVSPVLSKILYPLDEIAQSNKQIILRMRETVTFLYEFNSYVQLHGYRKNNILLMT